MHLSLLALAAKQHYGGALEHAPPAQQSHAAPQAHPDDGDGLEADPVEIGHQLGPVRQHEEQDHRAHQAQGGMHLALNIRRQVLPVAGQGEEGDQGSAAAVPAAKEVAVVVGVAIIEAS